MKDPDPKDRLPEWDPNYSDRLYGHELSHPIVGVKEPWDEARHHAVFKNTGLEG